MRILAGKFKGRAILTPPGKVTRPTTVVTRKTVFDILRHASWTPCMDECSVLDAYAGTGAFGFEAMSRGARFCKFFEIDRNAFHCIRKTILTFGLEESTDVHLRSTLKFDWSRTDRLFDLIFIDPPYKRGLVEKTLECLRFSRCLTEQALAIVETARDETIEINSFWKVWDTREIGTSRVFFLGYNFEG